jgi:hypothetical protein
MRTAVDVQPLAGAPVDIEAVEGFVAGSGRVATHTLMSLFTTAHGSLRRLRHTFTVMAGRVAIILKPILGGWAVCLTDGQELSHFRGLWARSRALAYVRALCV